MLKGSEKMSPERFLIDTTVWVKYLRGLDSSLKERIGSLVTEAKMNIPEIIEIIKNTESPLKRYSEEMDWAYLEKKAAMPENNSLKELIELKKEIEQ
jgi:hypothetical protein